MTPEEYRDRLEALNKEVAQKKNELYKEYAFANNPYKIDDIISDGIDTIKIESIAAGFAFLCPEPTCVYSGISLKKDLTPKKSGDKENIWQSRVKQKLN